MLWWMIAALIAFFVKGLCGFANTLVFNTILSFENNNINITPVELLLGYPMNAILAWKERKSIRPQMCIPLATFVLIGCIPGVFFLKNIDVIFVKIIFGVVIISIGIEMLFREMRQQKVKPSSGILGLIGILSGFLCGLYGIGALLGAYVGRVTDDSKSFKANICVVFLVENTFRIILYIITGIITFDVVRKMVILLPAAGLGLSLGMFAGQAFDEKFVKKLVVVMLIISGISLVLQNVEWCMI